VRSVAGYLGVAVGLFLVGAAFLGAGVLDRNMAHAQQRVIALQYDEADQAFAASERYLDFASLLPWIGDAPVNDLRARRAEIKYWQRQYPAVIDLAERDSDDAAAGGRLQLVVANAVYRAGRAQASDRQTTLETVDAGIQAYAAVLSQPDRQDDAAYNYEYLTRLRDRILSGRPISGTPEGASDSNGLPGDVVIDDVDADKFQTIVPLTTDERKKDSEAGQGTPVKRKG
jgi:hypothetical protein